MSAAHRLLRGTLMAAAVVAVVSRALAQEYTRSSAPEML